MLHRKLLPFLFFGMTFPVSTSWSAGLVRDGTTARTQGMGGTSVAMAESPLEAMTSNPAALTDSSGVALEMAVNGIYIRTRLKRSGEDDATLRNRLNFLGDAAIAVPSGHRAIRLGLSVSPLYAGKTKWRYRDREGGLDGKTSFGEIEHESEFLAYNFQAGVGIDFSSWLSAGVSAGVVYNHNSLNTAYVFQSQETLQGFKTRLDLDTEGYAATGQIGVTIKPVSSVRISFAYTTPSRIHSEGEAHADLSAQLQSLGGGFAAVNPRLDADARVLVKLPQKVAAGVAWQLDEKLLLTAEYDWINWSDAFDELPVTLVDSSNAAVNGLVGSSQFTDVVPLRWRDQKIIRIGGEYQINQAWTARAGYAYSTQVVPSETLTPLSGAVDNSIVSAGIGYRRSDWHLDLSYQWHLPNSEKIDQSDLKTGEYNDSEISLQSHWLGLTYGVVF